MNEQLNITRENLEKNGITTYYCESKNDVVPLLKTLINPGDKVSVGGSVSLFECNVPELLKNGNYNYIDRYQENLTVEDIKNIYDQAYSSDVYLCSSNAVTENGILYNVDGNSNRISAIAYGAKSVIMVVGINKLVKNLDEAVYRVKTISAPRNTTRLNIEAYCKVKGKCVSLEKENPGMTDGCMSDNRICCNYLVSAKQRITGRIKVIFVNESLGY